ncbi:hypothetical protein PHYSODRAFT_502002 [Phytophthora sojae]|uniref:Uncharacterized protein n=1 Tax=Phytophthora sojae (strain P6497) TaxID=1094619 RepID=G4ZH16_PHYSP|nr:hypothetical protein PHYSODRAFT_502002 [Phytophthora sojae]EGZ18641.1 hypothetical protein PHYSODRAFT_502002 [Phytophthora sojae]|eukprot:XP_009527699.1 hypothetical protein PHYSODRAFT_502002 [Phytophthora sojae]
MQELLGGWLQPTQGEKETLLRQGTRDLARLADQAICWRDDNTLQIRLYEELPRWQREWSTEAKTFWPTYLWSSNPWIREANGGMLTAKIYNRIRVCTLPELHIQRIGLAAYTLRIPLTRLRQPPNLHYHYHWKVLDTKLVQGVPEGTDGTDGGYFILKPEPNGVHWAIQQA